MSIHEVFPYLRAKSAEEAVQFYKTAFGATEKFRLTEPGGRIGHVELLFGAATVMISDEFPELGIHALNPMGPSGFVLHLHVDDADAMIADAVKAGAQVVREAADQFYGERSGTIRESANAVQNHRPTERQEILFALQQAEEHRQPGLHQKKS